MDKKIKVGIVGIAGHGVTIREAVLRCNKMSLVSAYDLNRKELENFSSSVKCNKAKNYDEIVNDESIDAIVLVTPNYEHLEQGLKAIKNHKHVFVEKPITNYTGEAKELIAEAKKAKVILQVGHNMRKRPGFRKAKKLIKDRSIGDIVSFYANFSHDGGFSPKTPKWKIANDTCPLLPMMQLGIHFIDTIQYLLSDVIRVHCFAKSFLMGKNVLDSSITNLELSNGVIGNLQSHYVIPEVYEYKIFGTRGTIYVFESELQLKYIENGKIKLKYYSFDEFKDNSFDHEINEFAQCILNNKKPEVDGLVGLKALAVIEAMILSHKEKRTVEIKELL
jgi:UDP-N-acetylglucosamine 3-dehydrogenase